MPKKYFLFRYAIIGMFFALFPYSAEAATVYLSPGQGIQSVFEQNPAGTTFVLRAGTYRLQSLPLESGDVVMGEAGTILSGARLITSWSQDAQGRWFTTGQTQENVRADGKGTDFDGNDDGIEDGNGHSCYIDRSTNQPINPRCWRPEDVFANGQPLYHVLRYQDLRPGTFYFDYPNDRIYVYDNPSVKIMEASVIPFADRGSATNVTVKNIIFEKYANPAQSGCFGRSGSGWFLENIEVRYCHGIGLEHSGGTTVMSSKVHHNGQMGVSAGGDRVGGTMKNSEISFNNNLRYDFDWEGGGTKWAVTKGYTVSNNKVHNNFGNGIWFDVDNDYTTIENNHVYDNFGTGIFYEISFAPAVIRNNIVERNGVTRPEQDVWWGGCITVGSSGRRSGTADEIIVEGNTCNRNTVGIMGTQAVRGGSDASWGGRFPGTPYQLSHVKFRNNNVTQEKVIAGGIAIQGGWTGPNPWDNGVTFATNSYQLSDTSRIFFDKQGYYNFSAWQMLGQDVNGTVAQIGATTPVPPPPAPTPTQTSTQFLSDLAPITHANGWGAYEKDRANGDTASDDGAPLTLNGNVYAKGLGVHANSDIQYKINNGCTIFKAEVGVDDEVDVGTSIWGGGTVGFQVFADGTKLFDSGVMSVSSPTRSVEVDVTGKSTLQLIVNDGGDGIVSDHGDWADAKFVCGVTTSLLADVHSPSVPSGLSASPVSTSAINLSWQPSADQSVSGYVASGVAGYKIYRNGVYVATTMQTTYSDTGLVAGTSYSYTVSAYDFANNSSAQSFAVYASTLANPISTPPTVPPTLPPVFAIGAKVKTEANLNVRSKASIDRGSKIQCTQPLGSLGTIVKGPSIANGYIWWNINFNTGCDGWSAQTYLSLVNISSAPITNTLTVGSAGDEVTALQTILKNLGFFTHAVTGYFGKITEGAVIRFQSANLIEAIGIVGPNTRKKLLDLQF